MDVWGPARVRGQGRERYFLLVVDDYSRYTTVLPLHSKGDVTETFTLPASPQKNGIAERCIGMVMDVARTSMIHAAAPHFLLPFAVHYAAHQINLQPRVSLPKTTPTLRWTRKVGDAFVFCVWGSQAFVRDTSADKLSSRAVPCVFLGFPLDAPGWQFYHPTSHHVLSSQDVTFDEPVSYYRLFPYRTASLLPPPLFLALGAPRVDPLPPQGPAPSGVSQVDPAEPVEVAVDSGAARGAEPAGAGTRGAEPGRERAASGGPPGVQLQPEPLSVQQLREWYARRCRGAAVSAGAAGTAGAAGAGGAAGAAGGAAGAGAIGGASGTAGGVAGAGVTGGGAGGTSDVGGPASVGAAGGAGAAGLGGAHTGGTGAAGAGVAARVGPAGAEAIATECASGAGGTEGVVAGDPSTEGTCAVSVVSRGAARLQPYYVPLLQKLRPASPLPGPSPYSGPIRGLTERREPESRPVLPESRSESHVRTVRVGRPVWRPHPPPIPGTQSMTLRPSTAPRRVPLPSPPVSPLPDGPNPESNSLHAASPSVTRFLAAVVTDALFESTAASALVTELVDFAAACCLDNATSLVAESASLSVCPPSIRG
ncbi:unnamed protein product [Closterium sp. NIES-54]